MEIAPKVHAVRLVSSTAFLFAEDELTLIDAGLRGSGRRFAAYLHHIRRSSTELTRLICTHGHPDHIGGVRELATHRTEVLMHPADAEALRVRFRDVMRRPRIGPILALMTRGPEDAHPITDGDVIPVAGGLEVIHTPGHTPGSVCLYARQHRLLFTGDVLQVLRGRLTFASQLFSDDMPTARRSVERLAELDVQTIALSHYPPWSERANEALRALARRGATA